MPLASDDLAYSLVVMSSAAAIRTWADPAVLLDECSPDVR
jgi:hypothetical protein